ncbi:zf-TFIIB domain-containing protein [Haloferula sp.]|uniref:zf-TFIIB domain-containing protein n=1 Tax=Haloferula sp. TaxID=2497595 RepID=UPI0032A08E45
MNCSNCGGRLEGDLTICTFCESRQDIDLSQVHFRNLGKGGQLACPGCESTLEEIEFKTEPPIVIERCTECHGLFFNPGELEAFLESKVSEPLWLDGQRLQEIANNFGYNHVVEYLKCPMCEERMSHINFGGKSGVIMDRCGGHGFWLQGGELRRLMEWWRAGGKHLHLKNEQDKLDGLRSSGSMMSGSAAFGDSSPGMEPIWGDASGDPKWDAIKIAGALIGGIAAALLD